MINELLGRLNKEGKTSPRARSRQTVSAPCSSDQGRHDLRQDRQGRVRHHVHRGGDPRAIVEARGLTQVTDMGAIEKAVDQVIAANPGKAAR